jgi:outer membrane protein TolC
MGKIFAVLVAILLCATAPGHAGILTLRDAMSKAAASNYSLQVTAHDEKIAKEGILTGRSGFLPRIDAQAGYTAQADPQAIEALGTSIQTQKSQFGFFSLSLYQTLYDFGRSVARLERSRTTQEAAAFGYKGQEKDVFLQVVNSYFRILQAEKLLQAATEEVVQMTDHVRVTQDLYDQGVVTRNDLLQAGVKLSSSEQLRLDRANRLENEWLEMNYLTGQPHSYRAELEEIAIVASPRLGAIPDESLAARNEGKGLQKLVESSNQDVRESRSGYYPELFARLGLDYVQNDRVKEETIMAATVGVKINLFDGLATTSRYRQAVLNRSRTESALRRLKESIRLEYQVAANDARVFAEQIKVTEKAVQQGEENLRINKDRYQAQVGTATDVIDAQTLLTQVKTGYYHALYDYQIAVARVKKALGEL